MQQTHDVIQSSSPLKKENKQKLSDSKVNEWVLASPNEIAHKPQILDEKKCSKYDKKRVCLFFILTKIN